MKNVLITGGSGYLGSHLCKRLKGEGWRVVVFDLKKPEHKYYDHFHQGDIRDRGEVADVITRLPYQVVIHCASRIEVGDSMKNPTEFWEVNVGGTAVLLNAMRYFGVPTILFSSTAAIYAADDCPLPEYHPTASNSVYGDTKLVCEKMIKQSGLRYGIFRYFNLAGAHPDGDIGENHEPETHLIPCILGNMSNVKIFGDDYLTPDGTCIRDYVHVCDVADAHLNALEYLEVNPSIVVNLGTGIGYSIMQIIEMIERYLGKKIDYEVTTRRDGDPAILVANISKAKRLLNYVPRYDMRAILETANRWANRGL